MRHNPLEMHCGYFHSNDWCYGIHVKLVFATLLPEFRVRSIKVWKVQFRQPSHITVQTFSRIYRSKIGRCIVCKREGSRRGTPRTLDRDVVLDKRMHEATVPVIVGEAVPETWVVGVFHGSNCVLRHRTIEAKDSGGAIGGRVVGSVRRSVLGPLRL
jgi:hypothetical protein